MACNPLLSTDKLTDKILTNTGITDLDGRYVSASINFLKRIKVEIDHYYSDISSRLTNYEDLYYVTSQIEDSETFNFDNPIIQSFIEKIDKDINPLLENLENIKIQELTRIARRYIRNEIWFNLRDSQHDILKLQLLLDAINDKKFNKITIFTLNHDLIIEDLFEEYDIKYENGFGDEECEDGNINIARFGTTRERICFIKLHGSIIWQRYSHYKIELFENENYNSIYEDNPVFLIGTFNKMFDYTNNDIFLQLYHFFYSTLKRTNTIFISGYSFSDKGINTRLHRWMELESENKMIVIDPNCDGFKNSARGIISLNWKDWEEKNKLLPLSNGIDKTTWEKVKEKILTTQQ